MIACLDFDYVILTLVMSFLNHISDSHKQNATGWDFSALETWGLIVFLATLIYLTYWLLHQKNSLNQPAKTKAGCLISLILITSGWLFFFVHHLLLALICLTLGFAILINLVITQKIIDKS